MDAAVCLFRIARQQGPTVKGAPSALGEETSARDKAVPSQESQTVVPL